MDHLHDELLRTLSADGSLSVRVLVATNLVREAAHRHQTQPTATVALGRALMGALLLASESSDAMRVQLAFRGQGALGSVIASAEGRERVRGYVTHPDADVPLEGPHLGVADAIGLGELAVERIHPSWKRPYSGIVPLVTGEIAQDLTHYLFESEQKPSAVATGIYLGRDGSVEAAGGYLIQALPGAAEESLAQVEERIVANSNPSEQLRAGVSATDLLEQLLGEGEYGKIDRCEPCFVCQCDSERVTRAATLLGKDEIREIIARDETLEVRCNWCNEVYMLTADELGRQQPDA